MGTVTVVGMSGTVSTGSGSLGPESLGPEAVGPEVDACADEVLGFASGARGGVDEPLLPPVSAIGSAVTVVTRPPRSGARPREGRRAGPGETCGRLFPGPGTAGSRGTRTTGVLRSASRPWAEGEAGPRPTKTTALYRTADATVAERPNLS
jgi:hypothetical protein